MRTWSAARALSLPVSLALPALRCTAERSRVIETEMSWIRIAVVDSIVVMAPFVHSEECASRITAHAREVRQPREALRRQQR